MSTPWDNALNCLVCVSCQGRLRREGDLLRCEACPASYRVLDNNIIVFSAAVLSDEVLEKTMYGPEYEELINQVPDAVGEPREGTAALDFGCGSSLEVFNLANQDHMGVVFGLDYDLAPLQIVSRAAREKGYNNVFLIQFDREDIPFATGSFDLITSHQAFEHVPRPDRVIQGLAARMKTGATMRVDFPNGHSIGELLRELFHRLNRTQNPHISMISLRRAKEYFQRAGLEVAAFESTYALRGPLVYFIEGFVLRFLLRKHKIYTVRDSYRKSAWFRWVGRMEAHLSRVFPQIGQAFVFELRKPPASEESQ